MYTAIMHKMRRSILRKLISESNLTFSELFNNEFRSSSQFNYHLSWLIKNGYVTKSKSTYKLSRKGKELANYLDTYNISLVKQPLVVLAVLLKSKDRIIISKSLKEPIKNLWGLSCFSKAHHGESTKESLSKEVYEKTGLSAEQFTFRGLFSIKTVDNNTLIHHHLLQVFLCDNFSGKLIRKTKYRENKLIKIKFIKNYNMYPDNEFIIKHVFSKKPANFFELERDLNKGLLKLI